MQSLSPLDTPYQDATMPLMTFVKVMADCISSVLTLALGIIKSLCTQSTVANSPFLALTERNIHSKSCPLAHTMHLLCTPPWCNNLITNGKPFLTSAFLRHFLEATVSLSMIFSSGYLTHKISWGILSVFYPFAWSTDFPSNYLNVTSSKIAVNMLDMISFLMATTLLNQNTLASMTGPLQTQSNHFTPSFVYATFTAITAPGLKWTWNPFAHLSKKHQTHQPNL